MKKIVITGATSFIGIHLIRRWLKTDCRIYAVIRPNSRNARRIPQDDRISVVEAAMQDYGELARYIQKADVFYHFSWEGARIPFRDDEQMQNANYQCSVKAMESAIKMGCRCFVGSGSQAEYGLTSGPVDEQYLCLPTTAYGKYKLKTFETLAKMAETTGIRFIWMRIFSLYGEYDYPGSLIMSCLDKMSHNETVEMTACTQKWDYLYIVDAVEAMFRFAEKDCESGVYNIANGNSRPLKKYVEDIRDIMQSKSVVDFGAVPYGHNGPVNLEPKVEKVQKALDWKAETSFWKGINNLLAWRKSSGNK